MSAVTLRETREPVSLRCLLPHSSFVGCADIRVSDATECSSECGPNVLFAAIPGTRNNGAQFVDEAIQNGASALLVKQPLADVSVPQCVVPNVRKAYARLCAKLAGDPSRRLKISAVTGTNGKTTVTWLIRSILEAAGQQTGSLGTIEYSDGAHAEKSELTTPDSRTLSNWLARMVRQKTQNAAIELSSHALDQDRASGTELDVAVVTNITQDHFDYHATYEAYYESKSRILGQLKPHGLVVLNADDPGSASLVGRAGVSHDVVTYGMQVAARLSAEILDESLEGSRFVAHFGNDDIEISTKLVGRHNVSNCLAAVAAARHFDVSWDAITAGIGSRISVPGRLERVDCGQPFDVFVDYAHTDDALRRSVGFLRRLVEKRVICVFGAGGDRDKSKRPLLGKAASEADLAVVTSDNPRSEDPEHIIHDILPGLVSAGQKPVVEVDRGEAIRWALDNARPGDCVLVAGKGHEAEQIVGTTRIPFDDCETIRGILSGDADTEHHQPIRKCA